MRVRGEAEGEGEGVRCQGEDAPTSAWLFRASSAHSFIVRSLGGVLGGEPIPRPTWQGLWVEVLGAGVGDSIAICSPDLPEPSELHLLVQGAADERLAALPR